MVVTHEGRNNDHCTEGKKRLRQSKLLGNSIKTNFYHCFFCTHLFAWEWMLAEATFYTCVYLVKVHMTRKISHLKNALI